MTEPQMLWYAQNLAEDKEKAYEHETNVIEYLASFWNAEAVQKIRDQRDTAKDERFASDEEFERQIEEKSFIEADKLIRSIRDKSKNTNLQGNDRARGRTVRPPEDMSGLFRITKKR